MRVLQLIDSLETGGAERLAVNIANGLTNYGVDAFICATRAEGPLKDTIAPKVGYTFLNRKRTIDIGAIKRLIQFIDTHQITSIHAHATSFFIGTLVKLVRPKVNLIWHDHYGNSDFLTDRPRSILWWCSKAMSHIIVVNTRLQDWCTTQLKCKHVSYLPNYAVHQKQPITTQVKGISGKRIVCLANLRPQKDHDNLIKAFKKVQTAHQDWTLHCVGKDFKDAYSEQLLKQIEALGLQNKVFIYGSCIDTSAILNQVDIGVLASKSEGLPLALLEYGLAGLPVVVTDVGDCKTVIKNTSLGFVVPANDDTALAEALLTVINQDDKRLEMGENLQKQVSQQFSEEQFMNKLLDIYNKVELK